MSQKISDPVSKPTQLFEIPFGRIYYCLMAVFTIEVAPWWWPRLLAKTLSFAGHLTPPILVHTLFTLWIASALAAAYSPTQIVFRYLFALSYLAICLGIAHLESNQIGLDWVVGLTMAIIMCVLSSAKSFSKSARWVEAFLLLAVFMSQAIAFADGSNTVLQRLYFILASLALAACLFRSNRLSQDRLRMMLVFAVLIANCVILRTAAFALSYCLVAIFFEIESLKSHDTEPLAPIEKGSR